MFGQVPRDWRIFSVFLAADAILSYAPLPVTARIGLCFVGILLPLLFFSSGENAPATRGKEAYGGEILAPPRPWLVGAGVAAILGLRFFDLTTFRPWPSGDEALQGYFAIDLIRQWDWRFFYTTGQHPPLLIWILTFFFRAFQSPFFNLWFPPAAFSAAFVFTAYAAARKAFSGSFSMLFACLLGFSFWPLYFGRNCVQGMLVPFFEAVGFYLLACLWKSKEGPRKNLLAAVLGAWTGLGSLTYTSWFIVLVVFVFLVGGEGIRGRKANLKPFFIFGIFLLLGLSPWVLAAVREQFGGYAFGASLLSGFFNWKDQLGTSLSYVTSLFWGPVKGPAGYGPLWGGLLNPVLASCFALGLLEMVRYWKKPAIQATALVFLLFLAPGLLSADHVEIFRIIQDLPFLLLITALGLSRLLGTLRFSRRPIALALLLGLSFGLDFHHLLKARGDALISLPGRPPLVQDENYWAYLKLKPVAQAQGPGWIFTDFILLSRDHTLAVATYPFNAAENPGLADRAPAWAAILSNVHYASFLAKRFPGSQWYPVTPTPSGDGGMVVGIIPVTAQNRERFKGWLKVGGYFHGLGVEAENMMNNPGRYRAALLELPKGYGLVSGDPFLESCFGEWAAQYHYGLRYDGNIRCLQRALQKGYPSANLYYKLGGFYWMNRQLKEARGAYRMAARSVPNYTNAREVLDYLDHLPAGPVSAH